MAKAQLTLEAILSRGGLSSAAWAIRSKPSEAASIAYLLDKYPAASPTVVSALYDRAKRAVDVASTYGPGSTVVSPRDGDIPLDPTVADGEYLAHVAIEGTSGKLGRTVWRRTNIRTTRPLSGPEMEEAVDEAISEMNVEGETDPLIIIITWIVLSVILGGRQ